MHGGVLVVQDTQVLIRYLEHFHNHTKPYTKGKVPDITPVYDAYVRASINKYEALRKQYGAEALMQFGTGKMLDLKGQYGLPRAGQFAKVHGRIVTDAWLANAQYGEVMDYIQEYHPHDINDAPYRLLNSPKGWEYATRPATTVITRTETGRTNTALLAAHAYSLISRNWPLDQDEDQAAIKWGIDLRRKRGGN